MAAAGHGHADPGARGGPRDPPPPGSWVKFRNLASRVIQGQLQSVFSKQSRWAKRPDVETGALGVLRLRLAGADGMINGACARLRLTCCVLP